MDRPVQQRPPTAEQDGPGAAPAAAPGDLMSPGEVAVLFGVDPKTVTRWSDAGKLACTRTLGGHRRYRREAVDRLLTISRED